jgi:hypothetical protein
MKVVWTFIAVICLVAAAIALWRQEVNVAFVIATLGVMAWFLRYRSELKESLVEDGSPLKDDSEAESLDEDS